MYDNLTASDIKKMQEEIEYRKLVVRKEALEAVKEARAHGDLSENFEYKAAKQDKNRNESRIRYLEKMIKTARIISDNSREGEVGLGDTVEVYIPDDDETERYKGNCQQPKKQEPQIILHPAGQVVFEYPLGYQKNSDDTADKHIAY